MARNKFTEQYDVDYHVGNREKRVSRTLRYTGIYYRIDLPKKKISQLKVAAVAATAVLIGLYILAGFANNAGSYVFYVILPYAALVFPVAFLAVAVGRFVRVGETFTVVDRSKGLDRLKSIGIITAVIAGIAAVGSLILMLTGGAQDRIGRELLFCLPCLAGCGIGVGFHVFARRIPVVELPKSGQEKYRN